MGLDRHDPAVIELLDHYERWRIFYRRAGRSPRDPPDWENGRLYFRESFPHPDWTAFFIEKISDGYGVSHVSTERRVTPIESRDGLFSQISVAGRFIIAKIADYLRINCRLDPIYWAWESDGIDPRVDSIKQSDDAMQYVLRSDPSKYFFMTFDGEPYSHILPLTYQQLEDTMLEGFPKNFTSQLAEPDDP